ncbi:MAG TPA: dihydrofolate reductase family protein [Phototrophicaceae bacterium]|nr:dihydrofolate reductase family protein [Phototrophicaceae bacterium]
MRKVIVSNLMTLDGSIGRPNGDLDWFVTNDEFFDDTPDQMDQADTLLYGRVTYEGMASYWPTAMAAQQNPAAITDRMNAIAKVVFSKTLDKADWNNSRLVPGDLGEEVRRMKQQPGKDMIIFGSGQIAAALSQMGLIDIYRIFLNPVALGSGIPMFTNTIKLKLLSSRTFKNGVVVLEYAPEAPAAV